MLTYNKQTGQANLAAPHIGCCIAGMLCYSCSNPDARVGAQIMSDENESGFAPKDACPECGNLADHSASCKFAGQSAFAQPSRPGDYDPAVWNPAKVLQAIAEEQEVYAEETATPEKHIKKVLSENSAFAAQAIVWLSKHSREEKMRFDASRYIIERTMGKVNDVGFDGTVESATKRLFDKVTVQIGDN